ncbi:MAG: hypothetical protein ACK46X_08520 [Candidatus Sericytochromatia bacterium]
MSKNVKLAAAVALVITVAGCQVKAPAAIEPEGTIGSNVGPGKTGNGTGAQVGAGATGNGSVGSGTVGADVPLAFDPAKLPTQAQALVGAKAMPIAAATGGMYRSADGKLVADIPPGVLSQDATIKIARVDTANQPASDYFVPGILFSLDLGGAELAPDTQIMVRAEVDARFVDEMKARDPNFKPETYALSQVDGKWFMGMPVKGPSSTSVAAPATQPVLNAWNLNEFGGFPVAVTGTGVAAASTAYKVAFIPGSYEYDYEDVRLSTGQVIRAPRTTAEWSSMEAQGLFGCGAFPHCYYYGKLATRNQLKPQRDPLVAKAKALRARIPAGDLAPKAKSGDELTLNTLPAGLTLVSASAELPKDKPVTLGERTADTGAELTFKATAGTASGTVVLKQALSADVAELYTAESGIRALDAQADAAGADCNIEVTPAAIKTNTTWSSDDPALNGKKATGVNVRFSMLQNPVSGPGQVISDGSGNADSHAQAGSTISITPSITLGPSTGATVTIASLAENQATVDLKVVKNSPRITLKLTSADLALAGSLTVKYTIDGTPGSADLSATGKTANASFFARVPGDGTYTFKVTEIVAGDLIPTALPAAVKQPT